PCEDVGKGEPAVAPEAAEFPDLDEGGMSDPRGIVGVERLQSLNGGMFGESVGARERDSALDEIINALGREIEGAGIIDCFLWGSNRVEGLENFIACCALLTRSQKSGCSRFFDAGEQLLNKRRIANDLARKIFSKLAAQGGDAVLGYSFPRRN